MEGVGTVTRVLLIVHLQQSLGLAYVEPDFATQAKLEVEIFGWIFGCSVVKILSRCHAR